VVAHACNPSTQEAKAEGSQVWGQPDYIGRLCLKYTLYLFYIYIYLYIYKRGGKVGFGPRP
jgi:hypothetical protein